MTRAELLQFDGIGRNILERRIAALVAVLDAANKMIAADDVAQAAISIPEEAKTLSGNALEEARQRWIRSVAESDERYERAWEQLRSVLKTV